MVIMLVDRIRDAVTALLSLPSTTCLFTLLGVTFAVWYILCKTSRENRMIAKLPGLKNWPIVGDALHIEKNPSDFIRQLMDLAQIHRSSQLYMLMIGTPRIVMFSAQTAERLLSSSVNITKSANYNIMHRWLGTGLLTSTGAKWKSRRRILTPSFHFSVLKDFQVLINRHARGLKDKLQREVCDTDRRHDISKDITSGTLDIICNTAMGVNLSALDGDQTEYLTNLHILKEGIVARSRSPLLNIETIFKLSPLGRNVNHSINQTHRFTLQVIKERREAKQLTDCTEEKSKKHKPFLDMLLDCKDEDGNPLTDDDIREEVDTFMFEGHDTVSSGISFTIFLLGENIEAQRRCQKEIDAIVGDSDDDVTASDLTKMTYLECCIKEAMRIFPPVPFFARSLEEETEFAGYQLPKGAAVSVFAMALHRDPNVFPDPERFDPERFTQENSAKRKPFAYVPFSAGPRNCIGQKFAMMELKIIIAKLLKSFNIESTQTRAELCVRASMILLPLAGIHVKLTSRHR